MKDILVIGAGKVGQGVAALLAHAPAGRGACYRVTLADRDGAPRPPDGREVATAVISGLAAAGGAWGVRVHDVPASRDAAAVAKAWSTGVAL